MIVIDRLWCIDYDHTNPEYCKISNTILICFADFFVNVLVVSVMVASGLAQPRSDCPADGVVTIGHKKSCTKYYLCLGGKPMEQKCAFGLIYDHRSQKCNLEKDAKCTLDICPADKVGSVQSIPHPEDCAKYYICASGRGVQLQCGKNLLFNQITNTCDHAATVYCVRTKFWTGWVDRFDGFDDIFILYLYMFAGSTNACATSHHYTLPTDRNQNYPIRQRLQEILFVHGGQRGRFPMHRRFGVRSQVAAMQSCFAHHMPIKS